MSRAFVANLSGAELRSRLEARGATPDEVHMLVRDRDEPAVIDTIVDLLRL